MTNGIAIFEGITLVVALMAVAITFGVVLRTGKKLALSYKYFLSAIIVFTASELVGLLSGFQIISSGKPALLAGVMEIAFAVLFVVGIWNIRSCIKDMDNKNRKAAETK